MEGGISENDLQLFPDGTLAYFEFEEFKNQELEIRIACSCGGVSDGLKLCCFGADNPNAVPVISGICPDCQKRMSILTFFYIAEKLESGKTHYFCFEPWRGLDLPVRLNCRKEGCGGVSQTIFVPCRMPGASAAIGFCQNCKATLEASVNFEMS